MPRGPRADVAPRSRRWLLLTPVVATAWAGLTALVAGPLAGLSALGGGLGTLAFLAATPSVLAPVVRDAPHLSVLTALAFYAAKAVLLVSALVLLAAPATRGLVDAPALGWAVVVAVVTWVAAFTTATVRERRPAYDLSVDER